mgnify:CR=1 FL=1
MGGNIFTSTHNTVRLSRSDMNTVSERLHSLMSRLRIPIIDIPAYAYKDSFGDLDVVAVTDGYCLYKQLREWWPDDRVSQNGNVISFLMEVEFTEPKEYFQCDIICFPTKEQARTAAHYFAYNDLGNLIGRLYHSIGFKYGHDGLSYVRRDGDYQVYTMPISTDINKILTVIGLDPMKFTYGFHTLEEIFEYVASSPYYHPDIYLLENRNHTSRVRDRKRKTYMEFVKWSESHPLAGTEYTKPVKSYYLFMVLDHFEPMRVEYYRLEDEYKIAKTCKGLLNGEIVGRITGLQGVDLGKFMKKLRVLLPNDDIYQKESEDVEYLIKLVHDTSKLFTSS